MKIFVSVFLFVCLVATSAMGETVELKNGDKLDVNVVEETDQDLVVEHPQLGKVIIPKDDLKPPTPPNPSWPRKASAPRRRRRRRSSRTRASPPPAPCAARVSRGRVRRRGPRTASMGP